MSREEKFIQAVKRLTRLVQTLIACVAGGTALLMAVEFGLFSLGSSKDAISTFDAGGPGLYEGQALWQAPDTSSIPHTAEGKLIRYGRDLIAHTSRYLGPGGSVKPLSNGMNCQNCHLKAGTVPFGNNYGKVAATYPKLRDRSGTVEGFEKRINDCIERSLNGEKLDADSREMQAMIAYLKWVGKEVKTDDSLTGFGLKELKTLNRPADPVKGKLAYNMYCSRCHGNNGEGQLVENSLEWVYPPVHGDQSYNIGAGLYRLSRFAAFIKANMPLGVTFENPFLSDEEAWDIAAYVNSMPRPSMDLSMDWPDISKKPVDHPFGPYADAFTEEQHKYGPFDPIKENQP
jgi:thiosulfate dehydrogenase